MGDGITEGKGGLCERITQQQRRVAASSGKCRVVGLVLPQSLAELVIDLALKFLLEAGVDKSRGLGRRRWREGRLFPALHGYYYYC